MNIRPIKSPEDHVRAMADLTALLEQEPAAGSEEADRIEVLSALIEKYEDSKFPVQKPSPIEAIRFRMDQQGLTQKDLVPYIGSQGKVSEVLRGKRPLSINMIRALHEKLGIPAEVLIADPVSKDDPPASNVIKFPVREMFKRGYFGNAGKSWDQVKPRSEKLVSELFAQANIRETTAAYCRTTAHYRDGKELDQCALQAWQARVIVLSNERSVSKFQPGSVNEKLLEDIAQLSLLDAGPVLAREMLEKQGIPVVIEPHLGHTYLDGAAFFRADKVPVIGLTLRHDKLDNFWFTLLHELVHVGWHLNDERPTFFDDLDAAGQDELEKEADRRAADALIDPKLWAKATIGRSEDINEVAAFAQSIRRHPAIVAGRIQHETGNYKHFGRLLGRSKVRILFPEYK